MNCRNCGKGETTENPGIPQTIEMHGTLCFHIWFCSRKCIEEFREKRRAGFV